MLRWLGRVNVMDANGFPQLQDYRDWLRMPDAYTSDDAILSNWLIPAAQDAISAECGDVVPKTHDEYYDGGDYSIWLRNLPVLSVQLVEEGWGFTNYDLTEVQVNSPSMPTMFAFSIDLPKSGKISRRSGGNVNIPFIRGEENVHVIYTTGRDKCPGSIATVMLQLVAWWYQNFEQRQVGVDASSGARHGICRCPFG